MSPCTMHVAGQSRGEGKPPDFRPGDEDEGHGRGKCANICTVEGEGGTFPSAGQEIPWLENVAFRAREGSGRCFSADELPRWHSAGKVMDGTTRASECHVHRGMREAGNRWNWLLLS